MWHDTALLHDTTIYVCERSVPDCDGPKTAYSDSTVVNHYMFDNTTWS